MSTWMANLGGGDIPRGIIHLVQYIQSRRANPRLQGVQDSGFATLSRQFFVRWVFLPS